MMMKEKTYLLSQESERIVNISYNTHTATTEKFRRTFSIVIHEPETEQYFFTSYWKLKGVTIKKKNLKVFEANSKSFEISPAWHMSNGLKSFRSAY